MASAKNNPALTAFDQGTGRVDLAKVLTTTVTADPPSLALGLQAWPHDDDTPTTKEFAVRNSGDQPVTLDLAIDAKGPGGAPVPAGVFTVSPATITVPAGGEAKASVTADTRAATADGPYSGTVVASGGGVGLRVPVGVDREVESYDVAFEFTDAAGRPATDYFALVIGLDNGRVAFPSGEGGKATTRLPAGEYVVTTEVLTDGANRAVLPMPSLRVGPDTGTVTVDARFAKPIGVTYPDPAAQAVIGDLLIVRNRDGEPLTGLGTAYPGGFRGLSIGHLGPELPAADLTVLLGEQAAGTPVGTTPVHYRFAWVERGKVPTGFVRAPAKRELAEVRTEFGRGTAGKDYGFAGFPIVDDRLGGFGVDATVTTPGASLDYATTTPGVRWLWSLAQFQDGAIEAETTTPALTHQPGRAYRQRLLGPVYGPSLAEAPDPYLGRKGDEVRFRLPLFGDRHGNSGYSATASASTRLLRNGTVVGEAPVAGRGTVTVPPGAADYRVETEAVRAPGVSEFSTAVSGAWTFRSGTTPGDRWAPLPLTVVRFTPDLDANGAAPAGRVLRVPLVVEQQPGADNGRVDRLQVEVSFDDGKTWSTTPVLGRTAFVRNPAGAGHASLRVKGSDHKGNAFEHTVIRAYAIG
ncbi:MAG: hypothetical protein HOV94_08615 [Saccharothrix sp.]|nr:hypothetical protein [Saccharothrix sp.]